MQYPWAIESPAPGIIDRQSVSEALQTGLIAIDSSIPIGCGQEPKVGKGEMHPHLLNLPTSH